MELKPEKIRQILSKEKLMSVGTVHGEHPDNSVVCFAYDADLHLYFGSYSDTVKCRNISQNPHVAITVGTLQIHGVARILPCGSEEYKAKRVVYDRRFPKYSDVFELEQNELYEVSPLVIWNYNTLLGEMNRDALILDSTYYDAISPYAFHPYKRRNT